MSSFLFAFYLLLFLLAVDLNNCSSPFLDPVLYLTKYGYLDDTHTARSITLSSYIMQPASESAVLDRAIRKFQKFVHLNETGKLDAATLHQMSLSRCGNPDIVDRRKATALQSFKFNSVKSFVSNRLTKRHILQGSKWAKPVLHFRVKKYPKYSIMDRDLINSELRRAFDLWSEHANIEFKLETAEQQTSPLQPKSTIVSDDGAKPRPPSEDELREREPVDIEIRFETGFHGDSEPFDGRGLILGHAYFPEFGGSTHFDGDELWTAKSVNGVNLFQVAVHEFGHALGLEHSDNLDAIMAPFFRGYSDHFALHADDIKAIEKLYGRKKRNIKNPLFEENKPLTTQPHSHKTIDTFYYVRPLNFSVMPNKKTPGTTATTVFSKPSTRPSSTYRMPYRLTYRSLMPNFPSTSKPAIKKPTTTTQPAINLCLDGRFDAISLLSDGFMYVFKDAYVFKFDSNFLMDPSYPLLIKNVFRGWNGLTYTSLPLNLDTVLYVPERSVTYFFKGNLYWRSSRLFELDAGYPKQITVNFKGLQSFGGQLDASFIWGGNSRVYFVEGNKYWRYDFELGSVEPGYPKRLDSVWHGLPPKVTDAFQWINGATYFFDEDRYFRFDDRKLSVDATADPPYPRLNSHYWFGCEYNFNRLGKLSSLQTLTTSLYVNTTTTTIKSLLHVLVELTSAASSRQLATTTNVDSGGNLDQAVKSESSEAHDYAENEFAISSAATGVFSLDQKTLLLFSFLRLIFHLTLTIF